MILTLIFLLQAHPAQKVSWWMWTLAGFFFLLGLGLLIYLMTRPKLTDQDEETETRPRKVFTDVATVDADTVETGTSLSDADEAKTPASPEVWEEPPVPSVAPLPETEMLVSPVTSSKVVAEQREPEQTAVLWSKNPQEEPQKIAPVTDGLAEEAETEKIAPAEETTTLKSKKTTLLSGGTALFADADSLPTEIAEAGKDAGTQVLASSSAPEPPAISTAPIAASSEPDEAIFNGGATTELASPVEQAAALPPPPPQPKDRGTRPYAQVFKEQPSASVGERQNNQPFDALRTRPMREPFEPPRIEPVGAKSQPVPQASPVVRPPVLPEAGTQSLSSTSRPTQVYTPADTPEFPSAPYNEPAMQPQPAGQPVWHRAQHTVSTKPSGSILGLPVEPSHAPIVVGEPVKSPDEIGVSGFSNYGKPQDTTEKSRGGLIALAAVIVLLGGGTLAYFSVPSFHGFVDRVRGAEQHKVEKSKAQIIPGYPEVNKKMVKAKGAVLNISDSSLENLAVEVALYRGAMQVDSRTIPVTPSTLEPSQQGEYVFEYDGSNAGFSRYTITKLSSSGGDVKFTIPKQ